METVIPYARQIPLSSQMRPKTGGPFAALSRVSPTLAEHVFWHFYWKAPRYRAGAKLEAQLSVAETGRIGGLATYTWGRFGAPILLIHGWAGSAAQMAPLASTLARDGQRVVAFDLPAHGRSPGTRANGVDMARAITAMQQALGTLGGVAVHSLSSAALFEAVNHHGIALPEKLAFFAPVTHFDHLPQGFAARTGFDQEVADRVLTRLRKLFGDAVLQPLAQQAARTVLHTHALLFVHDLDDKESPFIDTHNLIQHLPRARLIPTAGLGHNRVLGEKPIVEEVRRFLLG